MSLERYRRMRDFGRTAEPEGGESSPAAAGGLRFVVQKHAASRLHYDFRLEMEGVLRSWAVPKGPSLDPGARRLAMHVEDHPLEYGSFEGVIPEGEYGGGTVMLWDAGEWIPEGDAVRSYQRGRLKFRLEGEKLRGGWTLVRMKPRNAREKESWLLIKEKDAEALPGDDDGILDARPESVVSGRDMDEIAHDRDRVWSSTEGEVSAAARPPKKRRRGRRRAPDVSSREGARKAVFPEFIPPQLATLVTDAPDGDEWLHEMKLDGYRILCASQGDDVRLVTRKGNDWTERFAEIADALRTLPCAQCWLDGEVVVLNDAGVSDFQALQNALTTPPARRRLHYFVFDLLYLDGFDLRATPLLQRKQVLAELLRGEDRAASIRMSDHVVGQGPSFHAQACAHELEGIISKRASAPYQSGRGTDWRKIKCLLRQEFVIAGWTDPSGSRTAFGALVLGVHDADGRLVHAGRVGTGFTDRTLRELHAKLKPLGRRTSALSNPPRGAAARDVHWVEPELVAEVAFTEWTGDGAIRHPSFQGLREDKPAAEIVRESPGRAPTGGSARKKASSDGKAAVARTKKKAGPVEIAGVRLSNPDRVLYPGQNVTKQAIAEYYAAVEHVLLPQLKDRPLTLVRCPSGRDKHCFYQKHANEGIPDIVPRVMVDEDDGQAEYMRIDGLAAVIALVQLGVLEFHVWGAKADRLDRPDRLVFDLDPDESLPWTEVVAAALLLRERLDELGLISFVKTTGGKGLHVVVPIERRTGWDDAKNFTRSIAEEFVQAFPHRFIAVMTKSRRKEKIFLDYLRNAPNATSIAAYSTRAREGATVSMPLAWEELAASTERPVFDVNNAPAHVKGRPDPWRDLDGTRQSLTRKVLNAVG